jgi:hypothetical protein
MKSGVIKVTKVCFVLLLFLDLASRSLVAEKTQCECPKPPGGGHGCDDQQVAYCKIKDGECVGWCGSVQTPKKHGEDLAAAILSESLKVNISSNNLQDNAEYRRIYKRFLENVERGRYRVDRGAERVFLQVPGSTQNKLSSLALHESQKDKMAVIDDASITALIKAKLATDGDINPFNIDVETQDGVVTLRGTMRKEESRTKAGQVALETDGVRKVINLIVVGDKG